MFTIKPLFIQGLYSPLHPFGFGRRLYSPSWGASRPLILKRGKMENEITFNQWIKFYLKKRRKEFTGSGYSKKDIQGELAFDRKGLRNQWDIQWVTREGYSNEKIISGIKKIDAHVLMHPEYWRLRGVEVDPDEGRTRVYGFSDDYSNFPKDKTLTQVGRWENTLFVNHSFKQSTRGAWFDFYLLDLEKNLNETVKIIEEISGIYLVRRLSDVRYN